MRVGLVTVDALLKSERLLEISAAMTLNATYAGMLAEQRKLGL